MKVIIWGLGTNGKNLIDVLDKDSVIAIIDTNIELLKLKCYQGIPIIDFNTYLNMYKQYYVIVTPIICESIEKSLVANHISEYFLQKDSNVRLSVFLELKHNTFIESYKLNKENYHYILGFNLFSLFLYNHLIQNDYKVKFIYSSKDQRLMLEKLDKKNIIDDFLDIKKIRKEEFIFQTEDNDFIDSSYINILDYKLLNDNNYLKWRKDLKDFKDIHNGKRIFIIATGPSLKISDLEILKMHNEITMSMNYIYYAFEKTQWRPNYYVVSDGNGIRDYEKLAYKEKWFENTEKFFSDNYLEFWNNSIDSTYHCFRQIQNSSEIEFSSDCSDFVCSGLTVVYSCLQLAVYMGFKEIFLLGCDFSFSPNFDSNNDHFYGTCDKGVPKGSYTFNYEFVLKSYEKAKKYGDANGISIYNATCGGKLEVFKRVKFDRLF